MEVVFQFVAVQIVMSVEVQGVLSSVMRKLDHRHL